MVEWQACCVWPGILLPCAAGCLQTCALLRCAQNQLSPWPHSNFHAKLQVEEGFDLCQQLQNVEVGQGSRPRQPITIASCGKLWGAAASRQLGQQRLGTMVHQGWSMLFGFITNERRDCMLQQLHQLIVLGTAQTDWNLHKLWHVNAMKSDPRFRDKNW